MFPRRYRTNYSSEVSMVAAMSGVKRAAAWGPSPRSVKLRRQGNGSRDVYHAMAALADLGGAGQTGHEPCVFLNAPAYALSLFDWSDLIGVLDSEAVFDADHTADCLFVDIPGAVVTVTISKQVILKEIIQKLHLEVYGYGFVFETERTIRAWIEMEVPCSGLFNVKKQEKFYSEEVSFRNQAMEDACAVAIAHLHKYCFVLVEDINFSQVRCPEKRALEAETWCTLLTDIVDSGKKDKEAMRAGYDAFFRGARKLCKDFSDVFPTGTIGSASTSTAPDDGKIYYGGPRPPVSRVEQFASKLLELIDVSASVFVAGDDVVQ